MVGPIEQLCDEMIARNEGRISTEPVRLERGDELGQLARAFNALLGALDAPSCGPTRARSQAKLHPGAAPRRWCRSPGERDRDQATCSSAVTSAAASLRASSLNSRISAMRDLRLISGR